MLNLLPFGYVAPNVPLFELNTDIVYGQVIDYAFPDPLAPNVLSSYTLLSGNPAKAGQQQEYAVNVNIILGVSTPLPKTGNIIGFAIGGIPFTYSGGGGTNSGDGNPQAPPNPTQVRAIHPTAVITEIGSTVEITLNGNCIVLAENGIKMGIEYFRNDATETTVFQVQSMTYSYKFLGVRAAA